VTHPLPIPGTAIDRVFLQPNAQCGSGNCTVVHAAVRVSGADAARATVIAFIWMASGDPLPAAATGPAASYNVNGQAAVSITYEVSSDLMVLKDVKLGIPSEVLLKGKGSFATIEIHDPAGKILAGPVKSDTF